jgi:transcriptional regulator with XRE-family HTH domain
MGDGAEFGRGLEAARQAAGLSQRKLAKRTGLATRRIADLERGVELPTDRELGALAQGCGVSVFDLLPPGYSLRILAHDGTSGAQELQGRHASDALLREYLSMVMELRSGRVVTAPTLRHDDLVELAAALGDTPEAIGARLVALLDAEATDAPSILSMILPSTATT